MKVKNVVVEKNKAKVITEEKPFIKPDYQMIVDQNKERLGNNPPDLTAVYDLVQLIARDVHEIKVRQNRRL